MQQWRAIIVAMLLCYPITAIAQRDMPTRQELDARVNPALSEIADGALMAEVQHVNIGTIDAGEKIEVSFTLRNTTQEAITITEIRSSCSCLKVATRPQVVEASGTISIDASLTTEGRKGEFRHNIFLYTALDNARPTERLSIEGVIANDDKWLHLPESMGDLRLTRKSVTITGHGEERIAVANTSTETMSLKAISTVSGLVLRTEPEVIEAGAEGDIVISYRPSTALVSDLETMLIIEGVEATPMDRAIRITIKRER